MVTHFFFSHQVLDLIERNGIDVNQKNSRNQTVLHAACKSGNLQMISGILSKVHDNKQFLNAIDYKGNTALNYLCSASVASQASANGMLQNILAEFIRKGADPFICNKKGNLVLHKARFFAANFFLTSIICFPVNAPNSKNQTPLQYAVRSNEEQLIELYLTYGADPLRNSNEGNAIYIATVGKHKHVLEYLQSTITKDLSSIQFNPQLTYYLWSYIFSFVNDARKQKYKKKKRNIKS